jgi:hypothetical protein
LNPSLGYCGVLIIFLVDIIYINKTMTTGTMTIFLVVLMYGCYAGITQCPSGYVAKGLGCLKCSDLKNTAKID